VNGAKLINRKGMNGCRYVASKNKAAVEAYAQCKHIPLSWIRYHQGRDKWYLRLWGRYARQKAGTIDG
jgi:hypothetical protein